MSTLTDFLKATGNEFAAVASDGISAGDVGGYYDTGSYSLNALISGSIYGGIPDSKSTGLAAASSAGKTFVALSTLHQFLVDKPEGLGIIFESESAISRQMLVDRGIDTTRVGIVPCTTLHDFRTSILKVIDNYEKTPAKQRKPLFLILDSLGMLSTEKEVADAMSGNNARDMTRAGVVRSVFRVITLRLGRARIPLIVTNHVYANIMAMYGGDVPSGGGGFMYACSTILTFSKAQDKDGDEVRGSVVTFTTHKSRLTREKLKIKSRILHKTGLDRYYGLIALAEDAGIIKKISNKYEFDDGVKAFESVINKNPTKYWTAPRLDLIEQYVQKKFKYGSDEGLDEAEDEVVEETE